MNRRIAIRNLLVLSTGGAMLNACGTKEVAAYNNIPLTEREQDMLSLLTESIIPTTPDFIGAKDLHANEFTLMMIDDCASPEDQTAFVEGLKGFDDACKATTGNSFSDATNDQRTAFLNALEVREGNDQPDNVVKFYRSVKRYTIQTFMSSEQYLTQVRNYSLIPPKFEACVPVPVV